MKDRRQGDVAPPRKPVECACGHRIFDGEVIRARVVRLLGRGAEAKCRCKRWVAVPLTYSCLGVKGGYEQGFLEGRPSDPLRSTAG